MTISPRLKESVGAADVLLPDLPRCAWLLDWNHEQRTVYRGEWVESTGDMIAEGAWVGEFSAAGALSSQFRCGSGAVLGANRLRVFAPTHSVEAVYSFSFKHSPRILVSNSVPLVLSAPEAAFPAPDSKKVFAALRHIRNGFVRYPRVLHDSDVGVLRRLAWGVFDLGPSEPAVCEHPPFPPTDPPFDDFASYREYLRWVVTEIDANAGDRARARPYSRLVASVSSGYDSPACAAIGASVGCREAVTLTTARGGSDDSGGPIARALGLDVLELPRTFSEHESLETGRLPSEAFSAEEYTDFRASPMGNGGDLVLQPFADHLGGSVFLTGFHGDKAWARRCPSGPEIVRGDNSGSGADEFRRRVGFVNVPLPFAGAQHWDVIARIDESDELVPYRVPGVYDRPIPRRIAEDAGVPRSFFGQRKRAAQANIGWGEGERYHELLRQSERYRAALAGREGGTPAGLEIPLDPPAQPDPGEQALRRWTSDTTYRVEASAHAGVDVRGAEFQKLSTSVKAIARTRTWRIGQVMSRLSRHGDAEGPGDRDLLRSAMDRLHGLRQDGRLASHEDWLEELDLLEVDLVALASSRTWRLGRAVTSGRWARRLGRGARDPIEGSLGKVRNLRRTMSAADPDRRPPGTS